MRTATSCLFLWLFMSLSSTKMSGQLSGSAFLAGQSNHSGIKVKFTAASGTAVTDSCFTAASGTFSVNISGGLYYVTYSKTGFQTVQANNGGMSALTNTVTLASVTLAAGTATSVSGNVSGLWSTNILYNVTGNLTVPNGTTLEIQPGTEIKFMGNYSLTVKGVIKAIGTPMAPIRFVPSNTATPWSELNLYGGPNIISYCEFRYLTAINNWSATSTISNSKVYNARWGILMNGGIVNIDNNDVKDFELIGIGGYSNSGTVTCNRISSPLFKNGFNLNRGINVNGSEVIMGNEVWDCQTGLYVHSYSTNPLISHNYFHDNKYVGMEMHPNNSATLVIANNTFHRNGNGIYNNRQGLIFCNNIITSSSIAVTGNSLDCNHNLIFNCTSNFSVSPSVTGLGLVVNTNSNGDPIDSYYNLFIDPKYGVQMPFVQAGSPALNAGNSTYYLHIGADPANHQCFSITTGMPESLPPSYNVFPNPSAGIYTVDMPGCKRIRVFDLTGRIILDKEVNGEDVQIDISSMQPGIFICELYTATNIVRTRLLKL
jgi:hypothetical protein